MQIELETAEDLRSELDTNGTAQELKYVCLVLEDEISALAKLPAEEIKDHPGVLLFEDDDELCDLLKQAEEEHSVRVRSEMELQCIADDEREMLHHYEV